MDSTTSNGLPIAGHGNGNLIKHSTCALPLLGCRGSSLCRACQFHAGLTTNRMEPAVGGGKHPPDVAQLRLMERHRIMPRDARSLGQPSRGCAPIREPTATATSAASNSINHLQCLTNKCLRSRWVRILCLLPLLRVAWRSPISLLTGVLHVLHRVN